MNIKSKFARFALIGTILLGGSAVGTGVADAAATGCGGYTSVIPYVSLPTGASCFTVGGSGLTVNRLSTSWAGSVICNYNVNYDFYDSNGTFYAYKDEPHHSGCAAQGNYTPAIAPYQARSGRVCSTLYSNDFQVARVCHSIHP
jgi:hypothetical protein